MDASSSMAMEGGVGDTGHSNVFVRGLPSGESDKEARGGLVGVGLQWLANVTVAGATRVPRSSPAGGVPADITCPMR